MTIKNIIEGLQNNKEAFYVLFKDISEAEYRWKASPETWSILELLSHLRDEEVEDFRARVKHVTEKPGTLPPPFDPVAWVTERAYQKNDYKKTLNSLLKEREASVKWLRTVSEDLFDNFYTHPKAGKLTAKHYLVNWLAHDMMHLRQLQKLRLLYLSKQSGNDLSYAGPI